MSWWNECKRKTNLRKSLFTNQSGRCFYCERRMALEKIRCHDRDYATIEHLGERADKSRVVLACQECNNRRGNKPVEVFVEELFG